MRRVDPADFTKVSALVNVVLGLDKPEQDLGHAYRVFELAVWECERCLQVPIGALFRSGDRWNVFVVEGERLRRVELSA